MKEQIGDMSSYDCACMVSVTGMIILVVGELAFVPNGRHTAEL